MFVYTHEAHPGERVPHHDSFETKLANARLLCDEVGIRRPILVDDHDGTVHRAYRELPNMTWVHPPWRDRRLQGQLDERGQRRVVRAALRPGAA